VQSDGALLLVTRCDPLLMSLALLDERRSQFSPLAQVLYPQATVLASCVGFDVALVCDVERHGDDAYVRLNDDKAVAWLVKKLERTKTAVLQSLVSAQEVCYIVGHSNECAALTTYTQKQALSGRATGFEHERRSAEEESAALEVAGKEAERRALQLLADYLPERLRDLVVCARSSWSLAAVLAAAAQPAVAQPAAAQKTEGASWEEANGYVVPRSEDYKKYTVGGPAAKKPKPAAVAPAASGAAQKRMEQAAKGSMKIASFFKPAVRVEE